MKVDVCVATKGELPKWWKENLRRLPVNEVFISNKVPLGQARAELISKVTTQWFVFIDDDVLVGKEWWSVMEPFLSDPTVGAVSGREQVYGKGNTFDKDLNAFREAKGTISLTKKDRGTTVDTLYRTDLVKDWFPDPPTLSAMEDYDLQCHVLDKCFQFLEVHAPAAHYNWGWRKMHQGARWTVTAIYANRDIYARKGRRYFLPAKYQNRILLTVPYVFRQIIWRKMTLKVGVVVLVQEGLQLFEFIRQGG